jgi:hypothetical protein
MEALTDEEEDQQQPSDSHRSGHRHLSRYPQDGPSRSTPPAASSLDSSGMQTPFALDEASAERISHSMERRFQGEASLGIVLVEDSRVSSARSPIVDSPSTPGSVINYHHHHYRYPKASGHGLGSLADQLDLNLRLDDESTDDDLGSANTDTGAPEEIFGTPREIRIVQIVDVDLVNDPVEGVQEPTTSDLASQLGSSGGSNLSSRIDPSNFQIISVIGKGAYGK